MITKGIIQRHAKNYLKNKQFSIYGTLKNEVNYVKYDMLR